MKITKAIATLAAIASAFVAAVMYEVLVPILNEGGNCEQVYAGYSSYEKCVGALGFQIPTYWSPWYGTAMPSSIPFAVFIAVIVMFVLLVVEQRNGK